MVGGPFRRTGHRSRHRCIQLVQYQLKVKLGNLVVHNKNRLVVVLRARLLQTQERIQADVVPIGEVVGF